MLDFKELNALLGTADILDQGQQYSPENITH
jgi:hypothetical protein